MKKLFTLVSCGVLSVSALSLTGCSSVASGSYHSKLYSSGGKAKGVVAMLPVFYRSERSSEVVPWNLSSEFTTEIGKRFKASGKVLLIKHEASPQTIAQFYSPLANSISPNVAVQFLPAEFVVAAELLDQRSTNETLTASVRVRVFDIRHKKVSMIYQEIIDASQPIVTTSSDYQRCDWRSKHFADTPMGLMHQRLFREIVARVEGYVCANYS